MNIVGHHHISMYKRMQNVIRIFTQMSCTLGLVEKSVNQDNPSMYHLFYGTK